MAFASPPGRLFGNRSQNSRTTTNRRLAPPSRFPSSSRCSGGVQGARMLVVEAKSTEDMDQILAAADGALVVIDYSTTWCGPCKVIAPIFERLSSEYTDVVFVKVMGDATAESGELMRREGIRAVPAFHFWKGSERVHEFVGAKVEEIESTIEEHK